MNPIEDQKKIIGQLYEIVSTSCPTGFECAKCRFTYKRYEDGSARVTKKFEYCIDGRRVTDFLDRELGRSVIDLVISLHTKMKTHTGGDWNAFTLSIDQNGAVKVNFQYPED